MAARTDSGFSRRNRVSHGQALNSSSACRRRRGWAIRCRTSGRNSANSATQRPKISSYWRSSRARTRRPSAGAAPPVPTAIVKSPRRTTAGTKKSLPSGSSAQLAQIPRARASATTWRFTSGVAAAKTKQAPAKCSDRYSSCRHSRRSDVRLAGSRHTKRTQASAESNAAALRRPTEPPPITTQRRSFRSRNNGNK